MFFFIIGTIHIGHMLKKPLWLLMPYKNLIATWSKPDWSCQGSFCHPKHFPAMVSIKTSIQIEYQNEKAVVIPHDLLLGHEGQQFLKLRPTSYPIIRLLHGHNAPRNASLTQLKPLQDLIEARNQEIKKVQGEEDPSGTGNQNLFDQEDAEFVPKKGSLLHQSHLWWPSLWARSKWIAWHLGASQPGLTLQSCWTQTTWNLWFPIWDPALQLLWSCPP